MGARPVMRRAGAALVAVLAVAVAPSAAAITPPEVDPQLSPPSGAAGPVQPMQQRSPCVTTGVMPGEPVRTLPDLSEAWRHSRGDGQLVAVLDTGVAPGPRLPTVEPGGDFVESTDGRTDCDGHGTAVAGLIAGQAGPDGFSGVAPAARILAIRQTSAMYSPRLPGEDPAVARATLEVQTLARAIVRAADLGARVITVATATCLPAHESIDQRELGAALRYAAVDKDAVIVAAAGDAGIGSGSCESNPLSDPARPSDPRNWDGVGTVSIPAWWQPFVLSVASVGPGGQPSPFTMAGPWVGIAAPGENITSLSNDGAGGLADGTPRDGEWTPMRGTGYAAAYISGVAALVRSRFPDLDARQVIARLTGTAHGAARSPSNLVGAGTIDPVAALTWHVLADGNSDPAAVREVAAPASPAPRDPLPRTVAFAGAGVLMLSVLAAVVARAKRKDPIA